MKLARIGSLAIAGAIAVGSVLLAAPAANAMPMSEQQCKFYGGQYREMIHIEFDENGEEFDSWPVAVCVIGNRQVWYTDDREGAGYEASEVCTGRAPRMKCTPAD